ncbi:MAG: hypothetical protein KAI86_04620, partial [Desulfobacterales bacterium]|nr:hypothetical protein [Desulfobacterales bacterium]
MNPPTNPTNIHQVRRFLSIIGVFALIFTIMMPLALAENSKEYIPPNYGFSTNYYSSYGEPDIYASVLGDIEFERGETAHIRITLANKGVLYGFKYETGVGTDEDKHASSLQELQYEMGRTTAIGIKAEMISTTPFIDIDPATSSHTLEELVPGELPEDPLVYTVTISNNAPAGVYLLQLPVSYEYQ